MAPSASADTEHIKLSLSFPVHSDHFSRNAFLPGQAGSQEEEINSFNYTTTHCCVCSPLPRDATTLFFHVGKQALLFTVLLCPSGFLSGPGTPIIPFRPFQRPKLPLRKLNKLRTSFPFFPIGIGKIPMKIPILHRKNMLQSKVHNSLE